MKRVIIQPADLAGDALVELKQWLGITRTAEDGQLTSLLHVSLDLFEAFTGQMALEAQCEELHAARRGWTTIRTCPVRAITNVEALAIDGSRAPIEIGEYDIEIDAAAAGHVRLASTSTVTRIVISFVAGLASEWTALPDAIRQGIIRLAAHHYLSRNTSVSEAPPASIVALWRPWKQVRL